MNILRRVSKQVIAGILCWSLLQCPVFFMSVKANEKIEGLFSSGAVLMDADSGRVLFSKNGNTVYAMASTTKIMTCILALELGEADQIVTFSDYAASMPDVQMNAKEGEQYYLKDLLYSLMLESHNDSAAAIAEAIAGDVKSFAKLMDQKAEAIGCTKTNFVTPNGLDGKDEQGDHATTAEELALILRYCISISSKAEEFIRITQASAYEFQELNGKRFVSCNNHNALLNTYEGVFTGKTGFTGKAGYCYAGAAKKDGKTMIIALLGAGWYPHKSYKWRDAKKLLDYGFENFEYRNFGKMIWNLPQIEVENGMKSSVKVNTNASVFQYLTEKNEKAECRVQMAKKLTAPVERGRLIGTVSYELDGKIIEQFQIYTEETVEEATFWNKIKKWLRNTQDFVENVIKK